MMIEAKQVIARHVQWKLTFRTAIALREQLTEHQVEEIRHHRLCLIGVWLDSPVTEPFRDKVEYHALVSKHIDFHREMEKVATLISQRRFDEAYSATSSESPFIAAGNALAYAITTFDYNHRIVLSTSKLR